MEQPINNRSMNTFHQTDPLARIPISQEIVAVLDSRREASVSSLVVELARRDRASVVIYDLSTGSRWTTPFETDDEGQHAGNRVLSAAQLAALGHHTSARAVDELNRAGVVAGAYLATRPAAEDLTKLVWARHIDLVIALGSFQGRTLRNVRRVRLHGASLVHGRHDTDLAVYPPLATDAVIHRTTHDRVNVLSAWVRRSPIVFR